jgi:GAF domain-containing protein
MTTLPHDDRLALTSAKTRITEMINSGAPLKHTLEELMRIVESLTPSGMVGSILILAEDGRHLRHGAGPSLPDDYNAAIDGIEIGPEVGSCGTAAFHARTVSVFDIANDPLWANFKDLALQYGLRACWSTPILDSDGNVLGTFANYYKVVRDPSPVDQELTEMIKRIAARAIQQDREAAVNAGVQHTTVDAG